MTNISHQYANYMEFLYQTSSDFTVPKSNCDLGKCNLAHSSHEWYIFMQNFIKTKVFLVCSMTTVSKFFEEASTEDNAYKDL